MDYKHITPTDAVDQILAQHCVQADTAVLCATVEVGKVQFLQEVRAWDSKDPDPELAEWGDAQATSLDFNAAKAEDRATRMATKLNEDVLAENRRTILEDWLRLWETEHAQHGVLIELAESEEQVEASTLAQLVIEGACRAAQAELDALK